MTDSVAVDTGQRSIFLTNFFIRSSTCILYVCDVRGRVGASASQIVSYYITRSTRPSPFSACNIEKWVKGWQRGYRKDT